MQEVALPFVPKQIAIDKRLNITTGGCCMFSVSYIKYPFTELKRNTQLTIPLPAPFLLFPPAHFSLLNTESLKFIFGERQRSQTVSVILFFSSGKVLNLGKINF